MLSINKEINKYINIRPKYFKRKELDDLNTFLGETEKYINKLELIKDNCRCNYLINENNLLKMKFKTIKTNIENIETKIDTNNKYTNKKLELEDIICFLKSSKIDKDMFFRFIIDILLLLLIYLSYIYVFYNNIKNKSFFKKQINTFY
jgi:hypothetical protein